MFEELRDKLDAWQEASERRRAELLHALEAGEVADPVTFTILGSHFLGQLVIGLSISAAVSVTTALVTRSLTPRQKITSGQLQGTIQVPQSDQGLGITEGFGADPGSKAAAFQPSRAYALEERVVSDGYFYVVTTAGTSAASAPTFTQVKGATVISNTVTFTCYGRTGGGFRLGMLIPWTSAIRKHVNKVTGGGGGGKGSKPAEQTEITYDLDFAVMPGRGPLRVKRIRANTDTIYQTYQNPTVFYQAEDGGNTKAGGAANVTDALASGGTAVTIPTGGSLQWNAVYGDSTAAILEFYYKASVPISVEFTWVGAAGTTIFTTTLNSTGGVYVMGYNSAAWLLSAGAVNTVKVKNLSATAVVFDRLGVRISGGPTGVPDTSIPADDAYTQDTLPTPNTAYTRPTVRFSGELEPDVGGAVTGTVQAGSYSGISIYPGNTSQLPDATIEAAVDAQYGAGSTPAFWNRLLIVLKNFFLTAYGGAIPLIQTLAEHMTLDTLEGIYAHWCTRVGVLTVSDYDFSGVRRVFVRGFPVTPPYAPADVMEELARVFNVYFRESDKIYAFVRGSLAPVATLTSPDLGWVDGDEEGEEAREPQGLDFDIATETDVARRYEITAVDPDRDFEQNSQGTSRQVTRSEKTEKIQLALTLYPAEMREVTQRELYEERIEVTKHRGSLDWSYIWLQAGDSLTVVETDGTTSRVFVESIKPNVGVIPFEGSAEETAVYSQPVSTSGGGAYEVPPVPIPGQTLAGFYDGPLLRDAENSVNNGAGLHVFPIKRRGDGQFTTSGLFIDRGLGYEQIASFNKQAVLGVTVTALTAVTNVHDLVADALTVDLHNETDLLESCSTSDLWAGAGACIAGDEVCQILSAAREPNTALYPNRWYLTIGLRARRGTDFAVDTHLIGERFVLIDDAVQFVPLNVNDAKVPRNFKMVSDGQSVDDAAVISFTWQGGSVKRLAPVNAKRSDDSNGNSLVEFSSRDRLGHGLHGGLTGFEDRDVRKFEFELTDSSFVSLSTPFVARVTVGEAQKAVLVSLDSGFKLGFTGVTINSFTVTGSLVSRAARALQRLTETNNYVEATLLVPAADAGVTLGLAAAARYAPTGTPDFRVLLSSGGAGSTLECYDGSILIYTENAAAYAATGVRVRVELVGSRLIFYKYDTSFGWTLLKESYSTVEMPAYVTAAVSVGSSGTGTIKDVMLTTAPDPKITITADQKTQYGVGPTMYAKITELDRRAGRGYPALVALQNSL